jgi:hypothetical protein
LLFSGTEAAWNTPDFLAANASDEKAIINFGFEQGSSQFGVGFANALMRLFDFSFLCPCIK